MSKRTYHPSRGDVIHVNLAPSAGREFTGPHFALVISSARFNRQTGLSICLPCTSKFHNQSLQVLLPDHPALDRKGWVYLHQIKTIDYRERSATFKCAMPPDFVRHVMQCTRQFIDPDVD